MTSLVSVLDLLTRFMGVSQWSLCLGIAFCSQDQSLNLTGLSKQTTVSSNRQDLGQLMVTSGLRRRHPVMPDHTSR